jgi:TIR domain
MVYDQWYGCATRPLQKPVFVDRRPILAHNMGRGPVTGRLTGKDLKPRLFISHTSKSDAAIERLDDLRTALEAREFDVIVDREQLGPGDEWRREIYTWLGLCDMAVVMIAPRALDPANPWVSREATILMWRRALDPDFRVVPVLVDGVTLADLECGPFRDLLLPEIQGEVVAAGADPAWISALADKLAERAGKCREAPVDALAQPIALQLKNLPDSLLREAASLAAVDLGPWQPQENLPLRLAVQMLDLGLEGSSAALDHLAAAGMATDSLERVLDLVAPSWVDLCAAHCLAATAARQVEKPALWLNAKSDWAARMFIRRASGRPPRTDWPSVPLAAVVDDDGAEGLAAQLRKALSEKLRLVPDALAGDDDEQLDDLLESHQRDGRPIFVVARHSAGLAMNLDRLKALFPALTFLVLGGQEEAGEDLPAGFVPIVPPLIPGEEAAARRHFRYLIAKLTGGN